MRSQVVHRAAQIFHHLHDSSNSLAVSSTLFSDAPAATSTGMLPLFCITYLHSSLYCGMQKVSLLCKSAAVFVGLSVCLSVALVCLAADWGRCLYIGHCDGTNHNFA